VCEHILKNVGELTITKRNIINIKILKKSDDEADVMLKTFLKLE